MSRALLSVGANIEKPLLQLARARAALERHPQITLVAVSQVYRSAPIGPQEQPDFFNAALDLTTDLSAHGLLTVLQEIEGNQGRRRLTKWGPRCIDLDLLLYNNERFDTPDLTVPHPRMHERAFVLAPLIEILGENHRLPNGHRLGTLRAACEGQIIRLEGAFPAASAQVEGSDE